MPITTRFTSGIPTLFLHTDLHERYHQPTDVAAKINSDGMKRVARLAFALVYEMAEVPLPPRSARRPRPRTKTVATAWKPRSRLPSGPASRPCGWALPGGPTTPNPIP